MANLNATGKILKIGKLQEVGAKNFKKRAILIEETIQTKDKSLVNIVYADFTQDKCSLLDNFSVGQMVEIALNVKSNEHEGKYYTNLTAYAIKESGDNTATNQNILSSNDSDLPF